MTDQGPLLGTLEYAPAVRHGTVPAEHQWHRPSQTGPEGGLNTALPHRPGPVGGDANLRAETTRVLSTALHLPKGKRQGSV